MKAVTVYKPFDLKIAEVPYPTIEKDDDVIIKVSFGGICGSDIGIYTGGTLLQNIPQL